MIHHRWHEIEDLYHSALKHEPAARIAFLEEACAGDEELRVGVEALLYLRKSDSVTLGGLDRDATLSSPSTAGRDSMIGRQIGSFRILALLGAGGMGEVYMAKDTKLGRDVAIKIIPQNVMHDSERLARFRREAQMLAALNHPNIATVYGMEEWEGLHCLVMELVAGQTLAERLAEGPLPLQETLKIGAQIAEALDAAHRKAITHRDIKPANIKVTPEGLVKMLDFGLAKPFTLVPQETGGSRPLPQTTVTGAGIMLGTPAYMSPEQLRGEAADHRADIWAFGCVLYELLAGQRPFPGANLAELIALVLKSEPDWKTLPSGIHPEIRDLLRRCLEKDPRRRLQSLAEVRSELESLPLSQTTFKVEAGSRAIRSLAVLPFVNLSNDPQMEYLGDGLTESIIFSLSQLPEVRVMARSTVFRHKGLQEDAQQVGRALGVGAVVTGRVLQRSEILVISAELIDVENGWQIWGAQYKRQSPDIFATEEEIAQEISEKLRVKLSPDKQQLLARRRTENVDAYHLYLKGRYYWGKRTEEALYKGLQYFREAIEMDPTYSLAYAGLAEGYVPLAWYCHLAPNDAVPKAKAAARKALEIDPEQPEALTVLASMKAVHDWEVQDAERQVRSAMTMDPTYPRARQVLSECLTMMGRTEEAIEEVDRALELDPLSLHTNAAVVMARYFGRRYERAIEHGLKAIELDANFFPIHFYLGLAYQQAGDHASAVAELQQARILSHNNTLVTASLGSALAAAGDVDEARQILHDLEQAAQQKYVPQTPLATVFSSLGDREAAFFCIEKALEEKCVWLLLGLVADPRFDNLRSQPRFRSFMDRTRKA